MLFEKVTKEHILQAIKDFEEKGLPNEFGPSSTYDLVFQDKKYPPKAIMAYANFYAVGRKVEPYFKGGINTDCFKAFENSGFNVIKKENKKMHEKLYKLKQEFLDHWPIEKLEQMTLEEYTDTEREDSFCYWLEHITRDLGSIVGGSSYKFGIYKRNSKSEVKEESNRTTDGEYAWFKKYGEDTKEEAFETVKSFIITIAKAAQNDTLDVIDTVDLGNAYKWKIAFLYGAYNCVNMFKLDALRIIASNLNINYNNKKPISYFHQAILKLKTEEEEYYTYCHLLWQQYQERLIDVTKDFSKWLNKNTFESYRAYLGSTNKSIEVKLDEINDFFDEIDFFLVDPKNVNGLVSSILFLMSKKERVKNPHFVEYDTKNSNGIPKAILGKNNYIKFLREKFDYVTPNYWVFQGNPKTYNITSALKAAHLKSWKVAAHKDKIKIGDQVILWQTGDKAGCYALAEIISNVEGTDIEEFGKQYYTNPSDTKITDRVKIKITKYLADEPILWQDIKDDKTFAEFKAGNQGTNFTATEEEFNALFHISKSQKTNYWIYAPGRNAEHWEEFYAKNTMAIGWDALGDLNQYKTKDEIVAALKNKNGGEGSEKNNATANFEFANTMQIGDVVIVKQGRSNLLGYGVITSDYFYDEKRENYTSCRKINWKQKGHWEVNHSLVLKTLTDITKYDSGIVGYNKYYDYLLAIINGDEQINTKFKMDLEATNQILYGPPGTGKTFYLKDQLFEKYTSSEISISQDPDKIIKHFEFVTFHQSFAYEDFIEGIKPIMPEMEAKEMEEAKETKDLGYDIEDGVFKNICNRAKEDPNNRYAIFIDEINRGNVSAIFGELITLIEIDKRKGAKNEMSITLPYSKKEFSVPSNLDIYGTMNTADRSVEALDTALRRRFEFKEMMPDYTVIEKEEVSGIQLSEVLKMMNQRIELLVDREHTIGHSYFVNVNTTLRLANAFNNKIVPLLQEYFYGDYGKIGLVLGKGFVEKKENKEISFADFKYDNSEDFKTPTFALKKIDETEIIAALTTLLGAKETITS
jgi:hypothetical protein